MLGELQTYCNVIKTINSELQTKREWHCTTYWRGLYDKINIHIKIILPAAEFKIKAFVFQKGGEGLRKGDSLRDCGRGFKELVHIFVVVMGMLVVMTSTVVNHTHHGCIVENPLSHGFGPSCVNSLCPFFMFPVPLEEHDLYILGTFQ